MLSRVIRSVFSLTTDRKARINTDGRARRAQNTGGHDADRMTETHLPRPYVGAPFATSAALAGGISPRRLRGRDLESPFWAVRAPSGSTSSLISLCRAYRTRAGEDEFFSHVTAARLWRLPLPRRLQRRQTIDSAVFAPSFPPQAEGVIGHRISRAVPLRTVAGLPVAPPIETWIELGADLSGDDLILATDGMLRRTERLATVDELQRAIARSYRRPGLQRLRLALAEARPNTDSPQETRARLIIARAGLPEPVVHFAVYNARGEFVGTPDLAYTRLRIAMEYEGDGHRKDSQTFNDDIERAELFQEATWRYVRITRDHVNNPHRLISRVTLVLHERGWRP